MAYLGGGPSVNPVLVDLRDGVGNTLLKNPGTINNSDFDLSGNFYNGGDQFLLRFKDAYFYLTNDGKFFTFDNPIEATYARTLFSGPLNSSEVYYYIVSGTHALTRTAKT